MVGKRKECGGSARLSVCGTAPRHPLAQPPKKCEDETTTSTGATAVRGQRPFVKKSKSGAQARATRWDWKRRKKGQKGREWPIAVQRHAHIQRETSTHTHTPHRHRLGCPVKL